MKTQTSQFDIPSVFCWTKMGAEAGQGLAEIVRRKELERTAGNGLFCWGIGNSLGDAPAIAQRYLGNELEVFFTRMKSSAKEIDNSPSAKFLWLSFFDAAGGEMNLPEHILVTSRANSPSGIFKRHHYALMCHRNEPISIEEADGPSFDSSLARNFTSNNAIGASQVTSVVRYGQREHGSQRLYQVAFSAKLARQGFVKLVNPILIEGEIAHHYKNACLAQSKEEWTKHLKVLKKAAWDMLDHSTNAQMASRSPNLEFAFV